MIRFVSILICLQLCSALSFGAETCGEPLDTHWSIVDTFPSEIDLVAVIDNPSEQLLSGAGRASRTMLGSIGMFSKTRRAWGAIGELFETDADGVVGALMSGRVVVLVDGLFDETSNPLKVMYAADTNWAVMGEVETEVFDQLRKKLKPVPREIVGGVPIYGIESGRYSMVMLKGVNGSKSRVMLSPKSGRDLLERALGAVMNAPGQPVAQHAIPRWSFDEGWGVAMRIRVDAWIGMLGRFGWEAQATQPEHLRCVLGSTDDGVEVSIAMDYRGDVPSGQAPVGLLGALGDDTVIAMAAASVIRMDLIEEGGLSIMLGNSVDDGIKVGTFDRSVEGTTRLIPEGSLFVFSTQDMSTMDDQDGVGMTVLSSYQAGAMDAELVDSVIEPLVIDAADGSRRTQYNGLFPKAVRTCELEDDEDQSSRVSWLTSQRSNGSELIFSFSGNTVDTGARVRKLSEASAALDAINSGGNMGGIEQGTERLADGGSSVLLSGFIRVGALLKSMADTQWMGNVELISDLGLVSWEVLLDDGVLRARVEFR